MVQGDAFVSQGVCVLGCKDQVAENPAVVILQGMGHRVSDGFCQVEIPYPGVAAQGGRHESGDASLLSGVEAKPDEGKRLGSDRGDADPLFCGIQGKGRGGNAKGLLNESGEAIAFGGYGLQLNTPRQTEVVRFAKWAEIWEGVNDLSHGVARHLFIRSAVHDLRQSEPFYLNGITQLHHKASDGFRGAVVNADG